MKLYLLLLLLLLQLVSCDTSVDKRAVVSRSDSLEIERLKTVSRKLQYNDPDSALRVLLQLRKIYNKNNDVNGFMDYYQFVTTIYSFMKQDVTSAKRYADSAWQLSNRKGNEKLQYKAHYTYGTLFMSQENYASATTHLISSIKLQPQPVDSTTLIAVDGILSEIYSSQRNYRAAVRYYEPVVNAVSKSKDTLKNIVIYLNMYYYCNENKDDRKAREYLFDTKALTESIDNHSLNSVVTYNLGAYYFDKGKPDSCIYYLEQCLGFMKQKLNGVDRIEKPMILLARQYIKLNQYQMATQIFRQLDASRNAGMQKDDSISYTELAYLIAKANHQFEASVKALETVNALKSEDEAATTAQLLSNHERDLDRLTAEKALISKNAQIKQQKTYITFSVLVSILLAVLAVLIYLYWRKKKMLETMKWEEKEKETRYKTEQAQTRLQIEERNRIAQEMHDDLGASLTSVIMAVELVKLKPNDPGPVEMINRLAHQLSQQINEIVWNLNLKNDNLQSLIDYMSRFTHGFLTDAGIKCVWDDKNAEADVPVQGHVRRAVYLAVKELMNNTVKHAGATLVTVVIAYESGRLNLKIADNGVGIQNNPGKRHGNGLLNINKSIEKLGGEIVWNCNNGTEVSMSIPL